MANIQSWIDLDRTLDTQSLQQFFFYPPNMAELEKSPFQKLVTNFSNALQQAKNNKEQLQTNLIILFEISQKIIGQTINLIQNADSQSYQQREEAFYFLTNSIKEKLKIDDQQIINYYKKKQGKLLHGPGNFHSIRLQNSQEQVEDLKKLSKYIQQLLQTYFQRLNNMKNIETYEKSGEIGKIFFICSQKVTHIIQNTIKMEKIIIIKALQKSMQSLSRQIKDTISETKYIEQYESLLKFQNLKSKKQSQLKYLEENDKIIKKYEAENSLFKKKVQHIQSQLIIVSLKYKQKCQEWTQLKERILTNKNIAQENIQFFTRKHSQQINQTLSNWNKSSEQNIEDLKQKEGIITELQNQNKFKTQQYNGLKQKYDNLEINQRNLRLKYEDLNLSFKKINKEPRKPRQNEKQNNQEILGQFLSLQNKIQLLESQIQKLQEDLFHSKSTFQQQRAKIYDLQEYNQFLLIMINEETKMGQEDLKKYNKNVQRLQQKQKQWANHNRSQRQSQKNTIKLEQSTQKRCMMKREEDSEQNLRQKLENVRNQLQQTKKDKSKLQQNYNELKKELSLLASKNKL